MTNNQWKLVNLLNDQMESESKLDLGIKHYIIDAENEHIGNIIQFYPKERYNEAIIIIEDVNGMRSVITRETLEGFLETYSPDDSDEPYDAKDIQIVQLNQELLDVESIIGEFSELAWNNREVSDPRRLMAREILTLRNQLSKNATI